MRTPPFNLPFTVRSGTTRLQPRTMAEFISARSGMANPTHFADGPLDRAPNQRHKCLKRAGESSV
jgi:hypothetical protein